MDFTSFSRTSALTNGGFGSIFLFTIGNNTVVFPPLQQSVVYFSSSTICIFSYSTIIPRWSTLRSSSVWKVGGKRIETRKETFPRTNCCFCFSFSCQKAEIYLQSAGTAVKKQKLNIPPNTSIAMIQNYGWMKNSQSSEDAYKAHFAKIYIWEITLRKSRYMTSSGMDAVKSERVTNQPSNQLDRVGARDTIRQSVAFAKVWTRINIRIYLNKKFTRTNILIYLHQKFHTNKCSNKFSS